ncbi:MAG: hypothetical protein HOM16_13820, partial [Woeseia sp.]|nr:hypothetical protein [Woeseia sp.]
DITGKPAYQTLVLDHIEPPIQIAYHAVEIEKKRVGIYEIGDCQDRPYMMRVDFSERLRRGDAYMRVDKTALKVGRRALLQMFDQRTEIAVPEDSIEIGFPGEVIQKKLTVPTVYLRRLPSLLEHGKLSELAGIRSESKNSGSTTTMARLTHMRLFGSDMPYENRSETGIMQEIDQIDKKHEVHDQKFLFEDNALKLQLTILHQGDGPLENAWLKLALPNHRALHIAETLPKLNVNGGSDQHDVLNFSNYPAVSFQGDRIHALVNVGAIPAGVPVNAFEIPLHICVGSDLAGKQMTMRYELFASNLNQGSKGKLTIVFRKPAAHQISDF